MAQAMINFRMDEELKKDMADTIDLGSIGNSCAGSSPVTCTSMSVHNGFKLWTLILLLNFIRFVCGELVLCLLTFSLMRILLWGYTPRLRLFGCWLCSSRPLMTVAPSSRQNDNRSQCVECSSFCRLPFRTRRCGR